MRWMITSATHGSTELQPGERVIVGRSEEATIRIRQVDVARRQCEIWREDGDVFVRDLKSPAGTYVNDEQILQETRKLRPGDVVMPGHLVVSVDKDD